jgi:hypothetical protein
MASIIGIGNIEAALLKAFEEWTEQDINQDFWKTQFEAAKWEYSGTTIRRSPNALIKEAGPGKRDIYDYGKLYGSGQESYKIEKADNGSIVHWHWDATNSSEQEYALYVHDGRGSNRTPRGFTDDLSIAFSFRRKIGKAFEARVQIELDAMHAN